MDKIDDNINFLVLSVGVSIPVLFVVLIEISYVLESINSLFAVMLNLETFATFLLVFLGSITVSIILKAKMKTGALNGALVGLIGEVIVIFIITLFALLTNQGFQISQIWSWDFGTYLMFNLIFMAVTGVIGGTLGSIVNKYNYLLEFRKHSGS
jgi:hypothetical protein